MIMEPLVFCIRFHDSMCSLIYINCVTSVMLSQWLSNALNYGRCVSDLPNCARALHVDVL